MGIRLGLLLIALLPLPAAALAPPQVGPPMIVETTLEWRAFHRFSSADGLPQNSVLALLQDRDGFVYAGTQQGVARYDGQRWQVITLPTGGRQYAVGALAEDRDGALWIGTDEQGAWRLRDGVAERIDLPSGSAINAFWPAPDGRVWIATFDGLYRCAGRDCESIDAVHGIGARSLLAEGSGAQARLWVGSNGAGVLQLGDLHAAQPTVVGAPITRRDGLPNNIALALAHFNGDLWIGTGRGLVRHDGERLHVYGAGNGFPVAMVFGLQAETADDGRARLLATLRPGGLAEIEPDGRWRLIGSQRGLPSNAAHALLRERHRGLLWVGTMTAGIARIERERWALFDERSGLPDRIVLGVGWSAAHGNLWVGTAGGAVEWRDGRFQPLLPPTAQPLLVYDLLDAPDGDRWIAHGRGLQRWRGGRVEADYTVDNSALPAVSTDRLALRRSGDGAFEIYVASGHGLARWRARDGLRVVNDLPAPFVGGPVREFATLPEADAVDRDRLWAAAGAGLLQLDHRGWSRVADDCLDGRAVLDVAAERTDAGDVLWLATRDGLLQFGPQRRCARWPAAAALGALTHVRLHGAQIYAFGARGVLRLQRHGAVDQTGEFFGAEAGLDSPEIAASAIDDRGRLFAASAEGLAALAPTTPQAPPAAAPLRLLSARFGEDQRPLQRGALLPANQGSVRFGFALLAFDRESAVRYRSQLRGLQAAAGEWTADAEAHFARLPPGQFELVVEARDADGVEARPIRFAFAVAAPWWQRPWALFGAPLLLLALGLALGRWRLHATRRRAAELETEVDLRTRELAAANARLEEAAVTDPLTGLKNRRYFALAATAEAERARRAGANGGLLLALLDIDHFKRINDAHGHDAGDAVLVEVARRLQAIARGGDIVLRWGGEEFLLLLRDVGAVDADGLLQRILHALAGTPVAVGPDRQLAVSASIGAVGFPVDPTQPNAHGIDQAITLADGALYRAKHDGRQRAVRVSLDAGAAHYRTVSVSASTD